jgi:hypothetical protein
VSERREYGYNIVTMGIFGEEVLPEVRRERGGEGGGGGEEEKEVEGRRRNKDR